ncbi:MAG: HNH endonuclease [Gammaproteobacteria bacterium]|nr:HNH endonuclease [Gammaproteobacteria bacterium]
MERKIARHIHDLVVEYKKDKNSFPVVKDDLVPKPLSGFHQWADSKDFEGGFLIENRNGPNIWLLLIKWSAENDFYVVLFPENKAGPIAEIHDVVKESDDLFLRWRYRPSKRDGNNDKRKSYFSKYFFSLEVVISIPSVVDDVSAFLNELLSLSENREKADNLDKNTPDFRDSFPEGKLKERLHKQRERNSSLIKAVKQEALEKKGKLECQCCGFDFEKEYGELGREFIEAHHTKPVSELHQDGEETKKEDIALVCSNCHRMLHRRRPWLEMNELKKLTKGSS